MTRRRKANEQGAEGRHPNSSTPALEDEADILAEVGGERDEGGELLVDEETIRTVGAVDAESVRENRRMTAAVNKKRGGEKGVVFNTDDLLTKYEGLIKEWPPNTLDISVKRLTGTAVVHTIVSRPRSGVELYKAIKDLHGQYEEAQYEVKFLDTNQKVYRGTGRITMPDTRPAQTQGQPPMTYPPNGAPPPGYPPNYGYPAPPPPVYPPQQAQAPQQPSPIVPSTFDPNSMMSMMDQFFKMFQQVQQSAMPQPQPQPQFQPPPMPPAMPPMPSPQAGPAEMMVWMQQMLEMVQKMQGAATPARVLALPQPVAQAPAPSPPSPASSMAESMEIMSKMFDMFQKMQGPSRRELGPGTPPGPFRGPRPPYYPQGDQDPQARGAYAPPSPQAPPRQPTMMEQFRESMGNVRAAAGMLEEMEALLPGRGGQQETTAQDEDDDSPIKVLETGPIKMVINKSDGSTRFWETGLANADRVFKWIGEQHEVIQKAHAAKQQPQQQQQRQQLPPGYVEVRPGDQPPPGYAFSPPIETSGHEAEEQSPLPPPPTNVPPPIQTTSEPRRAWGPPTIPDQGEPQ